MKDGRGLAASGCCGYSLSGFDRFSGGKAWKSKPSWYIVAKNDRTIKPDCERFLAKRIGATTTEVASKPRGDVVAAASRDRRNTGQLTCSRVGFEVLRGINQD